MRPIAPALLACSLLAGLAGRASAQSALAPPRPPGVTDSTIAWGRALFHGSANCNACHGDGGNGTKYAHALTGTIWRHGPGTYEWLITQIKAGVPAHESLTKTPMPMRGWSNMPDHDVEAVAAYVWSITHPPRAVPRARGRS